VWAFYLNASTEIIIPIGEIIVASIMLFFLPKRVTNFIDNMFEFENILEGKNPVALLAESTIFKLKSVSEVAKDMATNVEKDALTSNNDEMSNFIKSVKDNTCHNCKNFQNCWKKNYHLVYEGVFNSFEILKNRNYIESSDIELEVCDNKEALTDGLNNAYELYKLDNDWKNKVKEDKKLVAKQLRGVSKAIDRVQEEMNELKTEEDPIALIGTGFKIELATSNATKKGSVVSGDSNIYVKLKNGKILFGISDGMGSGEIASQSSKKVLELLEKYINTGLEKNVVLDLINSYMMLGENKENYATLDVMLFDEDTGEAEMMKYGACPTYILHDGMVRMISSSSLPVGATMNAGAEILTDKFEHGTYIVMVSDGILEANKLKEKWVLELLGSIKSNNAQRIADIILQEALDESIGVAKDDMSVMVIKIC